MWQKRFSRILGAILPLIVLCVARLALAGDDSAPSLPDFSGQWVKLFTGLDMGVMGGIGIVAWLCKRSKRVPDDLELFIPFMLGLGWGIVEALSRDAFQGSTAYGVSVVVKGALLNGAGAAVLSLLIERGLRVAGIISDPVPTQPKA